MNLSITGIYRRIHILHLTNFRGSIEDFFFGKSTSKEHREWSNLHVNECGDIPGGDVHTHDSEKVRNQHQNVLIHQLVGS
jgi:hypothetical protein